MIGLALVVIGVILLLTMPLTLLFFAITERSDAHIPGTVVILTSVGGMAFVGLGAVLLA